MGHDLAKVFSTVLLEVCIMKVSARNVFVGKVTAVTEGPVNAEVELSTEGGDRVVAVITEGSVKSLGIAVGTTVTALVKAPLVMVIAGEETVKFSARNHLAGVVASVTKGVVNTEVAVKLPGGSLIHAIITNEALLELGLKVGAPASVLFKASHVVLAV